MMMMKKLLLEEEGRDDDDDTEAIDSLGQTLLQPGPWTRVYPQLQNRRRPQRQRSPTSNCKARRRRSSTPKKRSSLLPHWVSPVAKSPRPHAPSSPPLPSQSAPRRLTGTSSTSILIGGRQNGLRRRCSSSRWYEIVSLIVLASGSLQSRSPPAAHRYRHHLLWPYLAPALHDCVAPHYRYSRHDDATTTPHHDFFELTQSQTSIIMLLKSYQLRCESQCDSKELAWFLHVASLPLPSPSNRSRPALFRSFMLHDPSLFLFYPTCNLSKLLSAASGPASTPRPSIASLPEPTPHLVPTMV